MYMALGQQYQFFSGGEGREGTDSKKLNTIFKKKNKTTHQPH